MEELELEAFLSSLCENEQDDTQAINQFLQFIEEMPTAKGFEEEAEEAEQAEIIAARGVVFNVKAEADYEILENVTVQNDADTWAYQPAYYIRPRSLQGLVNAIQFAESNKLRVRALGSRHSFSQAVAVPKQGCYIDMSIAHRYDPKQHNATINLVNQDSLLRLKACIDKTQYFDVPAGCTVAMVNKMLDPDEKNLIARFGRRRLFNTGGGDIQAYAGAFSTGTHGSGGHFSTYHDTIRSILLVASEGKVYRIEPSNGITDPIQHQRYYDNHPDKVQVALIQDDDRFCSAIVNMGCFGVIHSVIIETMPMTLLHEEGTFIEEGWDDDFKKRINEDLLPRDRTDEAFYYLYINPYKMKKAKRVSISQKVVLPTDTKPKSRRARHRPFWPTFLGQFKLTAKLTRLIVNHGRLPKKWIIESALKTMNDNSGNKGKGYTDIAYKVWNQGTGTMATIGSSIEFAFPIDEVVPVLDEVIAILQREAKSGRGYYVDGPIAVRFVRAGEGYLAPNYHTYKGKKVAIWVYVEIITVTSQRPKRRIEELELYRFLQDFLWIKGGRVHWGLNFEFPFNKPILESMYPQLEKWIESYLWFNPNGTFDNEMTDKFGFREVKPLA